MSDVGAHKVWVARLYQAYQPNTVIISNGFASMGISLPGAIAAKLIHPERRVVALCGDGGFLMNSQELETARRIGANVTVVVWRDDGYGLIDWKQRNTFGRPFGVEFGNPDFVGVRGELRDRRLPGWRVGRPLPDPDARARCARPGARRGADRLPGEPAPHRAARRPRSRGVVTRRFHAAVRAGTEIRTRLGPSFDDLGYHRPLSRAFAPHPSQVLQGVLFMSSLARRLRRSQPGRRASVASLIAVFVIGLFAVAPVAAAPAVPGPGYVDFVYKPDADGTGGDDVTSFRNQSKLWFNDGRWWGIMFEKGTTKDGTYRIQSFNRHEPDLDDRSHGDPRSTSGTGRTPMPCGTARACGWSPHTITAGTGRRTATSASTSSVTTRRRRSTAP